MKSVLAGAFLIAFISVVSKINKEVLVVFFFIYLCGFFCVFIIAFLYYVFFAFFFFHS